MRKLSKSCEHLDRLVILISPRISDFFRTEAKQSKISKPSDIVGFGLLPSQVSAHPWG